MVVAGVSVYICGEKLPPLIWIPPDSATAATGAPVGRTVRTVQVTKPDGSNDCVGPLRTYARALYDVPSYPIGSLLTNRPNCAA